MYICWTTDNRQAASSTTSPKIGPTAISFKAPAGPTRSSAPTLSRPTSRSKRTWWRRPSRGADAPATRSRWMRMSGRIWNARSRRRQRRSSRRSRSRPRFSDVSRLGSLRMGWVGSGWGVDWNRLVHRSGRRGGGTSLALSLLSQPATLQPPDVCVGVVHGRVSSTVLELENKDDRMLDDI